MKKEKLLLGLILMFGLFAFTACQDNNRQNAEESDVQTEEAQNFEQIQDERTNSVAVTIKGNPELSTFANRMDVAAVDDSLDREEGSYTVFAPNNAAYSYLYREHGENALNNVNHEDEIGFLIAEGVYTTDSLRQGLQENNGTFHIPTLQGEQLLVSMTDNEIFVRGRAGSGAKIIESDIDATNGVIHIIETVILPGDIETHVRLSTDNNNNQ